MPSEWPWWPIAPLCHSVHGPSSCGKWCSNFRLSLIVCLILVLLLLVAHTPVSRWKPVPRLKEADHGSHHGRHRCTPKEKVSSTAHCPLVALLHDHALFSSLDRLRACHVVIYNRVPKCASRTVLGVFQQLSCQNGFKPQFERTAKHRYMGSEHSKSLFGRTLMETSEPLLFSRHLYFINFTRLGLPDPVYINVVRHPLHRAISQYYYNRHGSGLNQRKIPPRQFNRTLDECVRSGSGPCFRMENNLSYFCGHQPVCSKRGEVALKLAKRAVREHYLVVGLTEDLPAFMDTLSFLLPHFFTNASEVYRHMFRTLWARYRTIDKPDIDKHTETVLKNILGLEYAFYQFVRQHFYHLHSRVERAREEDDLGGLWGQDEKGVGGDLTTPDTRLM